MKRFIGLSLIALLLIGMLGVQAQDDCGLGISADDCELLNNALQNLSDNGDLYISWQLSVQLLYGASYNRNILMYGGGELERDRNGNIESIESGAIVSGGTGNTYGSIGIERYFNALSFSFEEDEFAFGNDEGGVLIEMDTEVLLMSSLFPFFQTELAGDALVEDIELADGEHRHYTFPIVQSMNDAPFDYIYELLFGQEIENLTGDAYYEANLLVNIEDETISGAIYRATEFIDGELFGLDRPLRRETFFMLRFPLEDLSTYTDFDIEDEIEDEEGSYEAAAQDGPIGLLIAGLSEDFSESFPPILEIAGLGGITLPELMGEDEPTATASPTATVTPTPTPLNTPVPTAEGYPCTATIAGDEGEIQRVIHRDPTEESTIIRAARSGEEVTVIDVLENGEGRWYHVSFGFSGGNDGYVLEENLVLGEECPE
jgi:hypothetical protein